MGPNSRVGPSSLPYGIKLKFEFKGFYPKTRKILNSGALTPGGFALDPFPRSMDR
jgi:hypothetical protein